MGKDNKFSCDICQAKLSNARNLRRLQKEAHSYRTKFFGCPEEGCASTPFEAQLFDKPSKEETWVGSSSGAGESDGCPRAIL